ncbi:glycosyltransferase family 4 protein [Fulvivirgaceae bacterium BMA12]|uniref:Glycosyltransferase family 4 protein n=1 Tax=Agaribacillus aureus TaxID=3051825 RepID=A0ABT8L8V4_9BACT|nr:glycosyltransferase family 4 protein [Fulvivirgaceae bacterium BMA12]
MKVLVVSNIDGVSGAARACYRGHRASLSIGIESRLLVKKKYSKDESVVTAGLPYGKFIDKLFDYYVRFKRKNYTVKNDVSYTLAIHPDQLLSYIETFDPDIVNLHWVSKAFIRLESLAKINKPIVWTLHDMWVFTGGCHYTQGCEKYKDQCGACPVLSSDTQADLSAWIFKRKKTVYKNLSNFHIVTPSRWMGQCASESSLLEDIPVHILPYAIDTDSFKPRSREEAKKKWNIPQDKTLILFGALKATGDQRKGFMELQEALRLLPKNDNTELLVFGSSEDKGLQALGFKVNFVGRISDDNSLTELYSAADVMVVPSLQENLSLTIIESLSCGLPVVAFDIGGNKDMIDHKESGYLAEENNNQDLANGIDWVIKEVTKSDQLSKNAREKVLNTYNEALIAQKQLSLYQSIIGH